MYERIGYYTENNGKQVGVQVDTSSLFLPYLLNTKGNSREVEIVATCLTSLAKGVQHRAVQDSVDRDLTVHINVPGPWFPTLTPVVKYGTPSTRTFVVSKFDVTPYSVDVMLTPTDNQLDTLSYLSSRLDEVEKYLLETKSISKSFVGSTTGSVEDAVQKYVDLVFENSGREIFKTDTWFSTYYNQFFYFVAVVNFPVYKGSVKPLSLAGRLFSVVSSTKVVEFVAVPEDVSNATTPLIKALKNDTEEITDITQVPSKYVSIGLVYHVQYKDQTEKNGCYRVNHLTTTSSMHTYQYDEIKYYDCPTNRYELVNHGFSVIAHPYGDSVEPRVGPAPRIHDNMKALAELTFRKYNKRSNKDKIGNVPTYTTETLGDTPKEAMSNNQIPSFNVQASKLRELAESPALEAQVSKALAEHNLAFEPNNGAVVIDVVRQVLTRAAAQTPV